MDGKCMHKGVAEFIFSDSCRRIKKLLLYGKGLSFHKIGGGSAKQKANPLAFHFPLRSPCTIFT